MNKNVFVYPKHARIRRSLYVKPFQKTLYNDPPYTRVFRGILFSIFFVPKQYRSLSKKYVCCLFSLHSSQKTALLSDFVSPQNAQSLYTRCLRIPLFLFLLLGCNSTGGRSLLGLGILAYHSLISTPTSCKMRFKAAFITFLM